MFIKEQVASLELSKELKKIGITQQSIFMWNELDENSIGLTCIHYPDIHYPDVPLNSHSVFSNSCCAFTASELLEIIPASIQKPELAPFDNYRLNIMKLNTLDIQYIINYECDTFSAENNFMIPYGKLFQHNIYDENLCNALAKLILYLYENKLLMLA